MRKVKDRRSGNLPKDTMSGDLNPAILAPEPTHSHTASFSQDSYLFGEGKSIEKGQRLSWGV